MSNCKVIFSYIEKSRNQNNKIVEETKYVTMDLNENFDPDSEVTLDLLIQSINLETSLEAWKQLASLVVSQSDISRPFSEKLLEKWNEDLRNKFGNKNFKLVGSDTIANAAGSEPLIGNFSRVLDRLDPNWLNANVIITDTNSISGTYGYALFKGPNGEQLEVILKKYLRSYLQYKVISEKIKKKEIVLDLKVLEQAILTYKDNGKSFVEELLLNDINLYLSKNESTYDEIKKKKKRTEDEKAFILEYELRKKLLKETSKKVKSEVKVIEKEVIDFIKNISDENGKPDVDLVLRYFFFNSNNRWMLYKFLPGLNTIIYDALILESLFSEKETNPNVKSFKNVLLDAGGNLKIITIDDFETLIENINKTLKSKDSKLETILDLLLYVNNEGLTYYTLIHLTDSKFYIKPSYEQDKNKAIAGMTKVKAIPGEYYGESTIPMFVYRGYNVVGASRLNGFEFYYSPTRILNTINFLNGSRSYTREDVIQRIDANYNECSLRLPRNPSGDLFTLKNVDKTKPITIPLHSAISVGERIKVLDIDLSLYNPSDKAIDIFNSFVTVQNSPINVKNFNLIKDTPFWASISLIIGTSYLNVCDSKEKLNTFNYFLAHLIDLGLREDNVKDYSKEIKAFANKLLKAEDIILECKNSTVKDDVFKIEIEYDKGRGKSVNIVIPKQNGNEISKAYVLNGLIVLEFEDRKLYKYSLKELHKIDDTVDITRTLKDVKILKKPEAKNIFKLEQVKINVETKGPSKVHIRPLMTRLKEHLENHFGLKINLYTTEEIKRNPDLNSIEDIFKAKAFIYNGEICVNLSKASPNDLVHEFMHLILGQIRLVNPKLYAEIVSKSVSKADIIASLLKDSRIVTDIKEEIFVKKFSNHMSKYLPTLSSTIDPITELKVIFGNAVNKTFALKRDSVTGLDDVANLTIEQLFDKFGSYILTEQDDSIKEFIHGESGLTLRKITNVIALLKKDGFIKEIWNPDGSTSYLEMLKTIKETKKSNRKGELKDVKEEVFIEVPGSIYSEEELREKIHQHITSVEAYLKDKKNAEKPTDLVQSEKGRDAKSYVKLFSDVIFSEDNNHIILKETVSKLLPYTNHLVSTTKGAIDKMENMYTLDVVLDSNYMGLYSYLDEVNDNGNHFITPFNIERLMAVKRRELLQNGIEESQIDMILKAEQEGYVLTARTAYDIHKAANIFFKSLNMSRSNFYRILSSGSLGDNETYNFETFHSDKAVIDSLYDTLLEIKSKILKMFPGCEIVPNILLISKVVDSSKKLVANIDLIVIEKSGKINVLKFKASNKMYGNLDEEILERDDYHLGFIRQMLAEKGFPANDIGLYTIGINMSRDPLGNLNSVSFEKIDDRLSHLNVDGKFNRLAWRHGAYSKNINKKIVISLSDSKVTIPFKDDVVKCVTAAFPKVIMSTTTQSINVDEFIKSNRIMKSDDPNYAYMFIDITKPRKDPDRKIYIKDSSEKMINPELRKKVEDLLKKEREARIGTVDHIVDRLQSIFNGELSLSEISDKPVIQLRMEIAFCKYIDGEWEFVKDPMLSDLGIYFILNKLTGLVDIINFTNFNGDLNEQLDFGLGRSIAGTFLKDFEAGRYSKLLIASKGNVELMKLMFVLNQPLVAAKLNGTFKIGHIRVINPTTGVSTIADNSTIAQSFNIIKKELKKNGIDVPDGLSQIQFMTPYEIFKQAIYGLMNVDNVDLNLGSIYASMERMHPLTLLEMRTELLKIEELMRTNTSWAFLNRPPVEIALSTDRVSLLYVLLWKCIWQCDGDFALIRKLSRFSGTRKDKTLFNGTMVNMPGTELDDNHKKATTIARKAMDRITLRLTSWYHPYRKNVVQKLWDSKGFTSTLNALIGNQNSLYSNMFVRNSDGKINENMMLKDPSDSSLSAAEKEFLEDFLWLVNSIRFKLTSKTDPKIAELKADKSWYWLPLVKGDLSSRLQLGVVNKITKSIKQLANELKAFKKTGMDDMLYTEEALKTFNEGIMNYKMFNLFTLSENSVEARLSVLDAAEDTSYWELNLETVLTKYMFANIRKEEFDRTLPLIKGLRVLGLSYFQNTGHPDESKLKEQQDIFDNFLKDYMEVSIYNKSILNDETRYLSKFVGKIKFYASTLALGLNFVGGIRECLEGAWKTVGKILSLWFSPQQRFTKSEWLQAVGIIITDAPDFVQRVTLLEAICLRYRIANIDMNALADRIKSNKAGIMNSRDRMLFWFLTSPDYFTRMAMLVALMIHEGVFEALGYDDTGLTYDWRKDKRFSDYAKGSGPNYGKQRGEYLSRIDQYNKDYGTNLTEKDDLPSPYTQDEILSLKLFSDMTFGAYDHDTKMLVEKIFLGSMFFLFKTYLSATKTAYFLSPGRYNLGERTLALDDKGNPLYWNETEDGKVYVSTEVSDSPYTLNTDSFMQGIYWSLEDAFKIFREEGISGIKERFNEDKSFRQGMIQFSYNMAVWLMLGAVISYLIKLWANHRKKESIDEDITFNKIMRDEAFNVFLKSVIGSFTDFNILNSFVGNIADAEPASIAILNTFFTSTGLTLFGDKSLKYWFRTNSGLYRSLQGVGDNLVELIKLQLSE